MTIQDFINKSITVLNDMGELRKTRNEEKYTSINFPNGWVASIIHKDNGYSVAICDYNGYFDWHVLEQFGSTDGKIFCKTEEALCNLLTNIESLKDINDYYVCAKQYHNS